MKNLIGYFRGREDCSLYAVRIVPTYGIHLPWEEITLAGDRPFVVTFDTSDTPFEPIRYSRATINVIADEYFMEECSPLSQGTQVTLTNEDTGELVWCGYMTNNLMNMPQNGCINTFSLEAVDALSTLKNYDYTLFNPEHKSVVTFQQILSTLMVRISGDGIERLVIDNTVRNRLGNRIYMNELKMSEQNFFSNDTDEPWRMDEVLEELCRYLGYTAVQWKDTVYLYDAQAHATIQWSGDIDIDSAYSVSVGMLTDNYMTYTQSNDPIFHNYSLTEERIMRSNSDISLATPANKITVRDSFYEIDHLIPDLYKDDNLENRFGDFHVFREQVKIDDRSGHLGPTYVNRNNHIKDDVNDARTTYFQRQFDNKYYHSIYRNPTSLAETETLGYEIRIETVGPILSIVIFNYSDEENDYSVRIANGTYTDTITHTIASKAEVTYRFTLPTPTQATYIYVNGFGPLFAVSNFTYGGPTRDYVGGTIVDCAQTTTADENLTAYNYEVKSSMDFSRYLLISQYDKPNDSENLVRNETIPMSQKMESFKSVFALNDNYANPFIVNEKAYITINGQAIFERYYRRDYMNENWTSECTGDNGLHTFLVNTLDFSSRVNTMPPALVFKLSVGGKWWNGTAWVDEESLFYVNCHTPVDDEGEIDYDKWWNTPLAIINNVPWTDWAGVNGYKIPLTLQYGHFDFSQPIVFEVCLPSKLQMYYGPHTNHDGFNNYCWLKDLALTFATKSSENHSLSDIVYENVVEEESVNGETEISMRFTTYPGSGMHSYSSVGYNDLLLDYIRKDGMGSENGRAEEQTVRKYYNQYSTNTIQQTAEIYIGKAMPTSRVKDTYLDKYFHTIGSEIDYAMGIQTVVLEESKTYNA